MKHWKKAEEQAVLSLVSENYQIVDTNWRTPLVEIDIICQRDTNIYFVEVKHRVNEATGSGIEAISNKKLRQMTKAANLWIIEHDCRQQPFLGVIVLSGDQFQISDWLLPLTGV